jgi:hypothetical protein
MDTTKTVDIISTILSDNAFAKFFPHPETWAAWFAFHRALYGLKMDENELEMFRQCTGRVTPRTGKGWDEAVAICGRRSGKSKTAALITAFEALFGSWEERVGPGEKFWLFVIATDRAQAGVVFSYIRAMLSSFPDCVTRETADELWLANGACIGVKTASFRALRGFSVAFACLDEMAFLRDERSANPAEEIITSILPSLLPGAKLLGITTPWAKFGLVYELWKTCWGVDEEDRLIWRAPTTLMNPCYKQSTIDRLLKRDRVLYAAEYMAEFREDLEAFIPEGLVQLYCTASPAGPESGRRYIGFVDPSGGRQDSFTLAIAHVSDGKVHLDLLREHVSPFVPDEVVAEYSAIFKHYGITEIISDRWGGVWVEDAFKKHGIRVTPSDLSASDLYLEFQPRLSSGQLVLLKDEKLMLQLRQLERRPHPGGRDKVDHPALAGFHDDVANAAAGAIVHAVKSMQGFWTEAEMEARLPVAVHTNPKALGGPEVQATRIRTESAALMDDWMRSRGGSKIIRR